MTFVSLNAIIVLKKIYRKTVIALIERVRVSPSKEKRFLG
ncbi:hypothetical protein DB29_00425 [Shouchella clausii]|nr:hypothetical protein DB29_00425 [Shouchella clausii]